MALDDHLLPEHTLYEPLTDRELEILQLLAQGLSNREIADQLVLALTTVKWYVRQIFAKLGVTRRREALAVGQRLGLLVDPLAMPSGALAQALPVGKNPYKGLRAFQQTDAQDFFGREALTQRLLGRLAETGEASRFLAVVGPSGSGKSSALRAGLLPALQRGALPGAENWITADLLPGSHPFDELELTLRRVAVSQPGDLMDQLQRDERGLLRAARLVLPDDQSQLLLLIDQFEELFTLVADPKVTRRFLDLLYVAAMEPRSPTRVVITLRADFYDRPLMIPDFSALVQARTEVIIPLTPDELEQAIVQPAQGAGVSVEPGLTAALVAAVNEQPGTLPLLEYTLTELFERREGRVMTLRAYQRLGGVLGALTRQADEVYDDLDDEEQAITQQLFLRLVTLGEGTEDLRRRVLRSELTSLAADGQGVGKLIDIFGASGLLTFDRDTVTNGPTVEVAHEALLREWERLRGWLEASRGDIRQQRVLAAAVTEWERSGRENSYLLSGARLAQFEAWAETATVALTPDERYFLDASLEERDRRMAIEAERQAREVRLEDRSRNFLRGLVAVLLLTTLGAFGLTGVAVNQGNIAQQARDNAQANFRRAEAQRLASEAKGLLLQNGSIEVAALLAIRSVNTYYTAQGDEALVAASLFEYPVQAFIGHTDRVKAVDYSPDGRHVLTGSGDSTVRLWNVQTGQEIRQFVGDMQDINSAVFSPDGQYVLTGSRHDHTVRLWDASTGTELRRFSEGNAGSFSLDGQRIFVFSEDNENSVMIDLATGEKLHTIPEPQMWRRPETTGYSPDGTLYADIPLDQEIITIKTVAGADEILSLPRPLSFSNFTFSTDNRYFALAADNQTIQLWDLESKTLLHTLKGHSALVTLAFSPDNHLLATGGENVRVWAVQSGQEIRHFNGHTQDIRHVDFSPDGRFVLSGGFDLRALLWDLTPAVTLPYFHTEDYGMWDMTISRDRARLAATISDNETVAIWDVKSGERIATLKAGHAILAGTFDFTPDGERLVTTSDKVRVWDVNSGAMLRELPQVGASNTINALDAETDFIVTAAKPTRGWSGGLIQWSLSSGQELRRFATPTEAVTAVISPDNRFVVTYTKADNTIRIFDVVSGEEIQTLSINNNYEPYQPSFSADSQLMFAGGNVVSVLWELDTSKILYEITGPRDTVIGSSFSQDGRYLATASMDNTIRIWETAIGRENRRITLAFIPYQVHFSADDRYILVLGSDEKIHVYFAAVDDTLNELCSRLLRDFTLEEREQYEIKDDMVTCPKFIR